ncbi:MAG: hypothetical protein KDB80_11115 [Planctomycetes bacterium]|nr:hypothetical protein [Planctomycetota bacterium]
MNSRHKISLGGGGYTLYAPRFPRFQHYPGFADEVLISNVPVPRLYMIAVLEDGNLVDLALQKSDFKNEVLNNEYGGVRGLKMREQRFVTTDDRFVCNIELENTTKNDRELTVVMWATTDSEGEPPSLEGDSVRIRRQIANGDTPPIPIELVFSSPDSKGARCLRGEWAEDGSDRPDFEETPWYGLGEFPTPPAKRPMEKPSPIHPGSVAYVGVFRTYAVKANSKLSHRFEANVIFKGKGINYRPRRPDPKDENGWLAFRDKAPKFTCEWKELELVVENRLRAIHMLRCPNGVGSISSPNIMHGNGDLHIPNAYAAASALREVRWLADPSIGRGILKGFFGNVRQNGMVPGNLFMTSLTNPGFFHADWGGGFEAFDETHSDKATKRAVIMEMQRYTKWIANNRDPEGSGLTDIVNQTESGQMLSRRFTVIDDKSDRSDEFEEEFRIKGIDASVFRYRLVSYLHRVAEELQEKAMANRFLAAKEVIQDVVRKRMWDDKNGIFMDLDPRSRRRTGVKAAVGFYPLATDIPTPAQTEKLLKTLSNRKEFWTKYPVPTLAISDPHFDAEGHWRGTIRATPWNGRTWPMANSQILEGLAYVAERSNKVAQRLCRDLFKRTIAMVSGELEGVEHATITQHYNPLTGRPMRSTGLDLLMDSFLMDNVFRIGCGIVVRFGEIQDDPVTDTLPDFKLLGVPVGNKRFNVERKNGKLKIGPA